MIPTIKWRWQRFVWWLQDQIRKVWNNNQCAVCSREVPSYPCNPFKKTWCEEHCPDHDYEYQRDMGGKFCKHCSKPYDYYY
jgi:hypothetical protein